MERVHATAATSAQIERSNRAKPPPVQRAVKSSYADFAQEGQPFFDLTATALISADSAHEQTWRLDLLPWNEHRPEAFAGLHNQGRRILVVMDEASVIPPIIWQTSVPVMTDVNTEIIWAVFGNP